jgi:hypothetical protein
MPTQWALAQPNEQHFIGPQHSLALVHLPDVSCEQNLAGRTTRLYQESSQHRGTAQ